MFKWSEIIERNKEQLIKALEEAYRNAVDYQAMEFSVEIYPDGTVRTTEHAAGSTFQSHDSWAGKSYIVETFCFQNMDIEITEETIRSHMTEEQILDAQKRADNESLSFMEYIYSSGRYHTIIEDCIEEWKEWYKDEYALASAEDVLVKNYEELSYLED